MHCYLLLTSLLSALISLAASQSIDPNTVPLSTRDAWCTSQITACPLLCLQIPGESSAATESNTCDPTTLDYSCVCANGLSPNASQYSQTVPYFICTQYNTNCVNSCNGDSTCQSACTQDHPCGAQNPTRVNTSTISTMTATSTSGGGASAVSTAAGGSTVYSGFGGATATSTASSGNSGGTSGAAAMFLSLGHSYGVVAVAAGILAGFSLL